MSDFFVRVVEIGKVAKHPNADSLSITHVYGGYQVIFNHTQHPLQEGMKAIYITVDAMLPVTRPEFAFLKKGEFQTHHKLKAAKIRSIFSMGLLVPCDQSIPAETDMMEALGITKYEPLEHITTGGECEKDPGFLPVYTDLESLRKHKHVITEGLEVVITEKIHGANGRFIYKDGRLWVGSHKQVKREEATNMWWKVAKLNDLEEKLSKRPGIAIYGEVYGQVQDLKYGAAPGQLSLAVFDALDSSTYRYLDYPQLEELCNELGLATVPVLYRGPWRADLVALAEGQSTLANHVREGFVVRPLKEVTAHMGRVILKMVGEGYHLRKESK